ncbi:MAG: GTP diphosphokinase [Chloroflexi bacterium]|nr:GTP diphosphokinase [Chloroflexota bacterium]
MDLQSLLEEVRQSSYVTPTGVDLIRRAYELAEAAHGEETRASGERYIQHPLTVAHILAGLRLDAETIAAALLHDVAEDTQVTIADIQGQFGEQVASLVDGVTKLREIDQLAEYRAHDLQNTEAESLRKMFLAMVDDVRVVLIKLADRLHNMRTLGALPEARRRRIAKETLDIFAPLANRLGIWQIKWELEDLAFRHLQPGTYKEIASLIDERRRDREEGITRVIQTLQEELQKAGIRATVSGRPKHIYSIYNKMRRKGVDFDKIYDVRAVRIVVDDLKDCYAALGVVHSLWHPIPGEFDDFIASPKDNMYQSLHTAVVGPEGRSLEVQIRTPEMHHIAEYGIAAHWRYKEGTRRDPQFEKKIAWLRQIMDWRQEVTDADEFLDSMRTDVFQDRVFAFTPQGQVVDLPAGSTPIDFAFHIHTEVGNRCRGARVNGRIVPLDYQLTNGDQVEIITAKRGGPSRDWLNPHLGYVESSRARQKIRYWFRRQDREVNVAQGREVLEKELRRLNVTPDFEKLPEMFNYRTLDDLLAAVGFGDVSAQQIAQRALEAERKEEPLPELPTTVTVAPAQGVEVMGVGQLLTIAARCCTPLPGDAIVGYVTRGRGVTIHRADCVNILRLSEEDKERLVTVSWGQTARQSYSVTIRIRAFNRDGLLRDITGVVADERINMSAAHATVNAKDNEATVTATLEVESVAQLGRVLAKIERLPNVIEAVRLKG